MNKHTPGPWKALKADKKGYVITYSGDGNIADVCTKHDAQLIASAPDLLEACKLAVGMIVDHQADCPAFSNDADDCDCGLTDIRKAIEKAEGK